MRPFVWMREKFFDKDTFTYTVTANYYEYSIEDIGDMSMGDGSKEMSQNPENEKGSTTYYTLAFPGKI